LIKYDSLEEIDYSFKREHCLLTVRCINHFCWTAETSSARSIWQKYTTYQNTMAQGPQRRVVQCNYFRLDLPCCCHSDCGDFHVSSNI